MEERNLNLFVGVPVHSQVSMHFTQGCLNIQHFFLNNNIPINFYFVQNSLITTNRNVCVSEFMQSKATHLLFIDSDVYVPYTAIVKMIEADKEVIASPYPQKKIFYDRLWDKIQRQEIKGVEDLMTKGLQFPVKVKGDKTIFDAKTGTIEISHAPTGCLLIKRQVIEKLIKKYPEDELEEISSEKNEKRPYYYNFFDCYHDKENKKYYGEDFGFSLKWSKIGGKIYAYIMEPLAHIGDNAYYGRMYDNLNYLEPV